ncbi:MAG: T9SS type A sorting domain-containing protein [Flammeovirgaceae bacterium]
MKKRNVYVFHLLLISTLFGALPSLGQYAQFQIHPSVTPQGFPDFGENFGGKIDMDNDRLIVADPNRLVHEGGVSIWEKHPLSGVWIRVYEVDASQGVYHHEPVTAVAIEGDWAFIGQRTVDEGNHESTGIVYVYHRVNGNWELANNPIPRFFRPNTSSKAYTYFGHSLSISNGKLAVGALELGNYPRTEPIGTGSVYIYRLSNQNWVFEKRITMAAIGKRQRAEFGYSVDFDGDHLIVGAPAALVNGVAGAGQVQIFRTIGTSWNFEHEISLSNPHSNDRFGEAVSVSEEYAVVGSPNKNHFGEAYVYRRSNYPSWPLRDWNLLHNFSGYSITGSSTFGSDVSISGSKLVIADQGYSTGKGAAHLYLKSGSSWGFDRTFGPSTGATPHVHFGADVVVSGEQIAVGAPNQSFAGVGYIFEKLAGACKACERSANQDVVNASGVVNAFPNPSSGTFTLQFPKANTHQISVFNATGKLLFKQSYLNETKATVNLENYGKGIYFIQGISANQHWTQKLVVE